MGLVVAFAIAAAAVDASAQAPLTGKVIFTRKPAGEEISAKRSERVVKELVSGGAVLDCLVAAGGALADCKVATEAPLDYGFGASALRLADQYRVASHTDAGEATAGARVRVPVTFNAARVGGAMTLMAYPIWVRAPSLEQVEAAYPAATAKGATGKAVVRCAFDIEGRTTDCEVLSQTPADRGFGAAALKLVDDFVVLHTADDADVLPGVIADIPVTFRKPETSLGKMPEPQWLTEVSAAGAEDFFPIAAREEAVDNGVGTVDCLVTREGGMTDCRVTRERPADLGFGAAAVQVAERMRINAWSETGRTFAGRRLTIPIRLRLTKPKDAPLRAPPTTSWGWSVQDVGGGRR
ncbi:MAG: hypothetical protein BGN86_15385 [Caulobacterales bacterium 68-7]|nr:MAG: hypothetical protein BGN86_15385 [Caulobacterales bacterium 68-7]